MAEIVIYFLKAPVIIVKARNIEFQDMLCLTWKTENIYITNLSKYLSEYLLHISSWKTYHLQITIHLLMVKMFSFKYICRNSSYNSIWEWIYIFMLWYYKLKSILHSNVLFFSFLNFHNTLLSNYRNNCKVSSKWCLE